MSKLLTEVKKKLEKRKVPKEHISLLENEDFLLSSASSLLAGLIERYVVEDLSKHFITIEILIPSGIQRIGLLKINSSHNLLRFKQKLSKNYNLADKEVLDLLIKHKTSYLLEQSFTPIFSLKEKIKGNFQDENFPKIFQAKGKLGIGKSNIFAKGRGYVAVIL